MTKHRQFKVTIIIPTYNQADYIQDAIDSALAQNYSNLEIIIGDDCSKDSTPEVVSRIHDPRIKYVRNRHNFGRTENYRNLLRNHATGDYIVNLDGDDYFTDPDFISEAIKLLGDQDDVIMIVARAKMKSSSIERISNIPKENVLTGLEILGRLPDDKCLFMHMAVLYARYPAILIDFYRSNAISSDWESIYRLSLRGKVKFMDRIIGVWRIHGRNETGTTSIEKLFENLTIWPSIYRDASANGMYTFKATMISARCIALFAQSACISLSKNGGDVGKFILRVFKKYKIAALLMLVTPKYMAHIILSLVGYYRRQSIF